MSSTTYQDGGSIKSRQESRFANSSTQEVVDEYEKRWQLAKSLVEHLFEKATETIDDGTAWPVVPQTAIGIVTNVFGFTPRNGIVESELHSKAEALPGSMLQTLNPSR